MDLISTGLESLIDAIVSKKIGMLREELSEKFANILHNEIKALKAEVSFLESKVNSLEIVHQSRTQSHTEPENKEHFEIDSVGHDPHGPVKSELNPTNSRKRKIRNSKEDGNSIVITLDSDVDDVQKAEPDNDSISMTVDVNHDNLNPSGGEKEMSEYDLSNFYDPEESTNFKLIMDSLDSTVRFREVNSIVTTKQNALVICTGCEKKMGYYSWKQHVIAIHAKLKPYVCQECGYNTSFIQHFRHHQRKIHQKTITNYRSRRKDRVEDYQKYRVDDDYLDSEVTNNHFSTIEAT